jgi:cobalt-zinc-cadmium efflux system outer membrane protein
MSLKRVLCAGVCACLALPAWAFVAPDYQGIPLSISDKGVQNIDPSLRDFIEEVWSESPAVQSAQAGLDAARAHAAGAGKALHNPVLELEAERTDINTTSVGFSQTLDWSDKRGALIGVAQQEIQAAQANLQQVRQRVAVETLLALVDYFNAAEMRSLALRRSQLMKGFVDTVKQRHLAGDVESLEVTFAQVAYSEALMAQATSEGELAVAEADLQAASGVAMAQWPRLPAELAPPPETADLSLLDALPHLAALRSQVEVARARIRVAEREGRVDPTFGVRVGREDSETLLGLSVEIPLFVRNNYRAAIRAASYESVEEEQGYRHAYQNAKARLSGALGRFENSRRAWQAWALTGQQAHREQIILLEKMWRAGELTATDFLIQAKQNIDTLIAVTSLKGEVWRAAIAWLEASGQVERWLGLAQHAIETNSGESR